MGMFDSVLTELICPFCGYHYQYSPPSYADAKAYLDKHRRELEKAYQEPRESLAYRITFLWDETEEQSKARIEASNSESEIQDYIHQKNWGLAEVQTKDWECVLANYYVGDLVEYARYGHYFIPSFIFCKGCCWDAKHQPTRHISVWIEVDNHIIKNVLTHNPETGQPERKTW